MNFKLSVLDENLYRFEAFDPETNELKDSFEGDKEGIDKFIDEVIAPKYLES